jgi:hypothetical protein
MPKRSNEFQRLVAMLTALSSEGATVHESVEVMRLPRKRPAKLTSLRLGRGSGSCRPAPPPTLVFAAADP